MSVNSTPLTAFHSAIRAFLDDEDHETHTAFRINEKIKAILDLGGVSGYKISADNSGVEPALTSASDQKYFNLLVKKTVLMFRKSLTEDQIFTLETDIHYLENGPGFSAF